MSTLSAVNKEDIHFVSVDEADKCAQETKSDEDSIKSNPKRSDNTIDRSLRSLAHLKQTFRPFSTPKRIVEKKVVDKVVLWELITCEIPYKDVDSSAIIWGVGSNSLHLPIPSSCPDGFRLLVKQCWSPKPRNRPSFKHILTHIDIAATYVLQIPPEEYYLAQITWKEEIQVHMLHMQTNGSHLPKFEDDLIKKRKDELKHAQDIREHYERKLARANDLCMKLNAALSHIDDKKRDVRREKQSTKSCKKRKSIVRPIIKAQEKLNAYNSRSSSSTPSYDPQTTSPDTVNASPVKRSLYIQVNGDGLKPESVVAWRQRKTRLRKSHLLSPKSSNSYFYPTDGKIALKNKINTETQTDESIVSPDYEHCSIDSNYERENSNIDIIDSNIHLMSNPFNSKLSDDEHLENLGRRVNEILSSNNTNGVLEDCYNRDENEYAYNFSIRRKSLSRRPIGPGSKNRRKVTYRLSTGYDEIGKLQINQTLPTRIISHGVLDNDASLSSDSDILDNVTSLQMQLNNCRTTVL